MQAGHETLARRRSPFVAAFLSLLFPGLGHAYLGAYRRGLGYATPPLLVLALLAGFGVRMSALQLAGLALQPWFQVLLFIANLVFLVYRAAAIVDAWSIARMLQGRPATPIGRQAGVVSMAGLAAVLLVMSGIHVAVARYDILLATTRSCIFDPDAPCEPDESLGPGQTPLGSGETPAPSLGPTVSEPPESGWDGRERLNILLIGADEQGGGHNTDTLIVVSIDPLTNQVAMFQLPRDTVDVPVPPGPAQNVWGSLYGGKINGFYVAATNRSDVFPGATRNARGYNGLKAILGNLYGLDVKYYVEVNFDGFRRVVDALGGVTINVQVPVLDDNYPAGGGRRVRLFIPAGIQHMTGAEALQYARSRKSTSDFERGTRQQRVLVSLRQQADIGQILGNFDALAGAVGTSVRTDIPTELVPQLLDLAQRVDSRSIRSIIFTPPFYQDECLNCPPRGYIITPRVDRIRDAVAEAFNIDPAFAETRDALLEEAADVWVLNGSGRTGEASRLALYLGYIGINASAPNQRPDTSGLATTTIRAYNGAEANLPLTSAALQAVFGVQVVPITDPGVRIDFTIITGDTTPQLTAPPGP